MALGPIILAPAPRPGRDPEEYRRKVADWTRAAEKAIRALEASIRTLETDGGGGSGVPDGGTTGQQLEKLSATDGDADWVTRHHVPAGGTTGQILEKQSGTDGDIDFETRYFVPTGGTTGQQLEKQSGTAGDVDWETRHHVPTGGSARQVLKKVSGTDGDAAFDDLLDTSTHGTTTGSIALDFDVAELQKVVLTGNPTFSTSNRANGKFLSIRIEANGADRTLAFSSSWKWLGTSYSSGTTLLNGKIAALSLTCYGTAETDVVAVLVKEP